MTKTVYTMGYAGRRLKDVLRKAVELDATVFDVRLSAWSRNPAFRQHRMQQVMGDRYEHVPDLGNVNYKLPRIEDVKLRDLEAGIRKIQAHPRPVILLCVCKHEDTCHRSVIADELRRRGYDVSAIGPEEGAGFKQLSMF